jgi:hypothetical protein
VISAAFLTAGGLFVAGHLLWLLYKQALAGRVPQHPEARAITAIVAPP